MKIDVTVGDATLSTEIFFDVRAIRLFWMIGRLINPEYKNK